MMGLIDRNLHLERTLLLALQKQICTMPIVIALNNAYDLALMHALMSLQILRLSAVRAA